jgi:hypothetical protein
MENFVDDNDAYFRLKAKCPCGCYAHCGHSCMTDDCDCFECGCPTCTDRLYIGHPETP